MMPKLYLVLYGDRKFKLARERLCRQAISFGEFEKILSFTETDIPVSKKKSFLWKPEIVKRALDQMEDGDILTYMDAGCHLNSEGKPRFRQYIESLTPENPFLVFHINYTEKRWTKKQVFDFFNISYDDPFILTNQLIATTFMLRKCEKSLKIIDDWYKLSNTHPNLFYFYEFNNQLQGFWNHRHDQSLFSILLKRNNIQSIPDETYFDPDWEKGKDYPFHAKRSKC